MGDTANWEFAAAVAAVVMGLGGLLLFTIMGTLTSWRIFNRAAAASIESEKAAVAVQDLARQISMREALAPAAAHRSSALTQIDVLRAQSDALMRQQARLQEAVRGIESGLPQAEDSAEELRELEAAVRRLEDNLAQIAAAVANLAQRQT
jgi:hypothetical protein